MDPKEFRAKYPRIKVIDGGEFETMATTEIINEDHDRAMGKFRMEIALHYPRRSTRNVVKLAIPARQDGKMVAVEPADYMMTQADFDAFMRGEAFNVPALY